MPTNGLPEQALALIKGQNFGNLATLMPDGTPQVTPVWVDTDGTHVLVNTAEGRRKARNMGANAPVAIDVLDQQNPYTYVQIRGHVAERVHEGAEEHIHQLARKYMGQDRYPLPPGEQRVIIKIAPDHVYING